MNKIRNDQGKILSKDHLIGIQVCSRYEWNCVKEILKIDDCCLYPYGEYFYTIINNKECMFFRSGVRKTSSAGACQYVISNFNVDTIFLIGTCGGVSEELNILDLVIASKTVQYDCLPKNNESIVYEPLTTRLDNSWIDIAKISVELNIGIIGTADLPLYEIKTVQTLREENILCSDCESASVAFICSLNNIRCCVIRGVSDIPIKDSNSEELQSEACKNSTQNIFEKIINEILYKVI